MTNYITFIDLLLSLHCVRRNCCGFHTPFLIIAINCFQQLRASNSSISSVRPFLCTHIHHHLHSMPSIVISFVAILCDWYLASFFYSAKFVISVRCFYSLLQVFTLVPRHCHLINPVNVVSSSAGFFAVGAHIHFSLVSFACGDLLCFLFWHFDDCVDRPPMHIFGLAFNQRQFNRYLLVILLVVYICFIDISTLRHQ